MDHLLLEKQQVASSQLRNQTPFQNLDSFPQPLQHLLFSNDFHALEQRRADLLSRHSDAQDAKDLTSAEAGFFYIIAHRRFCGFMRKVRQGGKNLIALARDLRGLPRVKSLCNEVFEIRFHRLLEEETCKRETVIQCDEPFADKRSHFEQFLVIYFESRADEMRLDAARQVFGRQQA